MTLNFDDRIKIAERIEFVCLHADKLDFPENITDQQRIDLEAVRHHFWQLGDDPNYTKTDEERWKFVRTDFIYMVLMF